MRCWIHLRRGLWVQRFNLILARCKQQSIRQFICVVIDSATWVGQNYDIQFPLQDASTWLSDVTSLLFWVDWSGCRQAQGTYLGILTWTRPKARYWCVHWKIIICWGLKFAWGSFPQFDWLLWHCCDFVSWNIHRWIWFFRVMLEEGWIL